MKRRNTQMKITVLSTLLLGCLLLMTVQGDSSARVLVPALAGKEGNKNKLGVFAQEEPFVRNGAGYMRKLGLGGKKFSRHEVTSKISGKDNDGLKKSSGGSSLDKKNDDQLMTMVPKEYLKSTKFVTRRSTPTSTNPKCSQDCNVVPVKSSLGGSSSHEQQISEEPQSKDETQRFADAAKEIANLIYKDYRGKPSHRPPINNHEPRN
ncbi:uncharacterized protein LOC109800010 isoform X2 [Cajanus cajan]|uniref:uncharacterized protein LOC109800010 isoform X2 n=1 Tax=Cajanus cajan TaxID=3821 RepID=UPI0010FBB0D7|nr:uncharacterized protein LOC109800010 isoform X2 [Cajanus cajan]